LFKDLCTKDLDVSKEIFELELMMSEKKQTNHENSNKLHQNEGRLPRRVGRPPSASPKLSQVNNYSLIIVDKFSFPFPFSFSSPFPFIFSLSTSLTICFLNLFVANCFTKKIFSKHLYKRCCPH
jgi:hypothetical protein